MNQGVVKRRKWYTCTQKGCTVGLLKWILEKTGLSSVDLIQLAQDWVLWRIFLKLRHANIVFKHPVALLSRHYYVTMQSLLSLFLFTTCFDTNWPSLGVFISLKLLHYAEYQLLTSRALWCFMLSNMEVDCVFNDWRSFLTNRKKPHLSIWVWNCYMEIWLSVA
jgi:hypothetical protein